MAEPQVTVRAAPAVRRFLSPRAQAWSIVQDEAPGEAAAAAALVVEAFYRDSPLAQLDGTVLPIAVAGVLAGAAAAGGAMAGLWGWALYGAFAAVIVAGAAAQAVRRRVSRRQFTGDALALLAREVPCLQWRARGLEFVGFDVPGGAAQPVSPLREVAMRMDREAEKRRSPVLLPDHVAVFIRSDSGCSSSSCGSGSSYSTSPARSAASSTPGVGHLRARRALPASRKLLRSSPLSPVSPLRFG